NQFPVGTGPFMIDTRVQDSSTRLVKNPDYWRGTDDIYVDAIEVFITTDTAQASEQLAAGALDVVITSNP
ncbi:MAG: ABC transporter substrate-binding protein, partial [Actinobacteria bacterium]|nr:ABC transporter substrate-binding protein [Actinomycetota bacterium]NIS29388.1 ABC transporter substrate-binding protein [Actinomycetota bacterium]NIT94495.1 ABC transporter substrate-binding protein [Actinomycetota bacterium]NIU18106.1 ABC transporter substrate-binding protein [Actinomycetota bacterium]NIU64750.1 ABC transporter substrate-binding protein [Actinomycetota bacterium]